MINQFSRCVAQGVVGHALWINVNIQILIVLLFGILLFLEIIEKPSSAVMTDQMEISEDENELTKVWTGF